MIYMFFLPLIFMSIVLVLIGKIAKFRLLERISKILVIVSVTFFTIEYLVKAGWDFENTISIFKKIF